MLYGYRIDFNLRDSVSTIKEFSIVTLDLFELIGYTLGIILPANIHSVRHFQEA